ncbi:MAG: acyl-CoA dehydrogenase [Chloroflexota bacterium]
MTFEKWVGKTQTAEALLSTETANLMQVTLNREPSLKAGDELPPAWHWLYFHEPVRADGLGTDGHPRLGGFMPPVRFGSAPPRRMWAGGNLQFINPISLGERATKRSTIQSITSKEGRSGKLVFVIVAHDIAVDGQICLKEEQTVVYREPVKATGQAHAAAKVERGEFSAEYIPDAVLLFRYSALTFNGHRIHYDVDYCRNHEGYPDLVVHGPLTATLLLDLFDRQFPDKRISAFRYRGHTPLFVSQPLAVNGTTNGNALATNHEDGLAMSAEVTF